jgi:hypothetical protein
MQTMQAPKRKKWVVAFGSKYTPTLGKHRERQIGIPHERTQRDAKIWFIFIFCLHTPLRSHY